ncbi:uncharacterized protein [Epargyreus clarus]|uniref:uncharacterized protein n=1 Tax=Epargyreus clarus TaxID=520877 RepID=UPI003C2DAC0E
MTLWKILFVCATFVFVEAKWFHHQKRDATSNVCDPVYNNTNKVQCYCIRSHTPPQVKSADCYPTIDGVAFDDPSWDSFMDLKKVTKLTLTNTRGIALKYIPTNGLKHTKELLKLDVKYGNIETVEANAFANLTVVEEISLRDNQIKILKASAFIHHHALKSINLDTNNIIEINRDVFIDLPALERLYLTNNKITTIHDRAFIHLANLKELEIDRNNIFSLNSESFSGLKNLDKLDLSSNSLEVIGDNTFLPLTRLRILNLDGNKIQMIDERGFHGLSNLKALSLAHNALSNLDNVKIFEGLSSLTSLSLKDNKLRELKKEVMEPILNNFYGPTSSLDIEDINFPCDCRLEWFIAFMNKTSSVHLKQALENLKCVPDPELRERYNNSAPIFEDDAEESSKSGVEESNADYEFYDDSQLNGKLFYTDLKFLLNCSGDVQTPALTSTTIKPVKITVTTTKAPPSPIVTTPKATPVTNQGLLDLSLEETPRTEPTNVTDINAPENQERDDKKSNVYTTSRLATVSAKPMENKYQEHDMASDEGIPDKIKAHRSVQEEPKDPKISSDANKNIGCVMLIATVLLRFY